MLRERYALQTTLGVGGLGAVFRAHDQELDRAVAVKLLRSRRATPARELDRLVREANAMARINHPNVVQVFDVGRYEGLVGDSSALGDVPTGGVFVVMELVRGQDLQRWLRKRRSPDTVLDVFMQAGQGLVAAHAQGVVHRDFKPANVLLASEGIAKVTDFGIAAACEPSESGRTTDPGQSDPHWMGRSLTATGMTMGTPAYMAPEQHRAGPVDARADQYSFCIALAEALYGRRLVEATTLEALLRRKIELRLPTDSTVPRAIRLVLERGTRPQRDERFESMEALLAALQPKPSWRKRGPIFGGLGVAAVVATMSAGGPSGSVAAAMLPVATSAAVVDDSANAQAAAGVVLPDRFPVRAAPDARRRAVRATLDELVSGALVDRPQERMLRIDAVREQAVAIGDRSLMAEANLLFAGTHAHAEDTGPASEAGEVAFRLAGEVERHDIAARAAVVLMGLQEPGSDAWTRWRRHTEVHSAMASGDGRAELSLAEELGYALFNQQDYEGALPHWRKATSLSEELLGAEHPALASNLSMLAMVQKSLDDPEAAKKSLQRALAIAEATRPDAMFISQLETSLADVLARSGDVPGAVSQYRDVIADLEAVADDDGHAGDQQASIHRRIARLEAKRGRHAEAVTELRLSIAKMGDEFPYNGLTVHQRLAESLLELGKRDEAIEALETGLGFTDPDAPEWEERVEARALLRELRAD